MSALPEIIGERYKPLRLIGRGGGGAVYEVEHVHTGARLALKVLAGFENASSETVSRFRREARLAAAIESENIVRITDAGTAAELDGTPFLVMELMQGQTLEREAKDPLPPTEVVELLAQVAKALDRAHAQGIVHRDLKPDNLFVTRREDGTRCVKVLDFGIAKRAGEGSTEQGTVLGTPTYMSPEQAQGHGTRVDARTDTWALGLVAFRLLFGRPYFEADSMLRLLHRVAFEPMVPPQEMGCRASDAFDAWFMRSCSRDIEERYASATQQVRDMAVALHGVTEVAVESRPTLELGHGHRHELDSVDGFHAGPASVTQPASTPRAARAPSAQRASAESAPPMTNNLKRKYFTVGAAIAAVALTSFALLLPPRDKGTSERPAGSDSPRKNEPTAQPAQNVEAPSAPQVSAPVAPQPLAPAASSAPDAALDGALEPAVEPTQPRRTPRKPAGAAPAQPHKYDPLGDQR